MSFKKTCAKTVLSFLVAANLAAPVFALPASVPDDSSAVCAVYSANPIESAQQRTRLQLEWYQKYQSSLSSRPPLVPLEGEYVSNLAIAKLSPDIPDSRVAQVQAYYNHVPIAIRKNFEQNGGTVTVASHLSAVCGYPYSIRGIIYYYYPGAKIMIDNRQVAEPEIVHEMGHYLDMICGTPSSRADFAAIHSAELGSFRQHWSTHPNNTATPIEYFAEAFKACIERPDMMMQYCPQSYGYIMTLVNGLQ